MNSNATQHTHKHLMLSVDLRSLAPTDFALRYFVLNAQNTFTASCVELNAAHV